MIGEINGRKYLIPTLDDYLELVYKLNAESFKLPEKSIYEWINKTTKGKYNYIDSHYGIYGVFGVQFPLIRINIPLYDYFANYKINSDIGLRWLKLLLKHAPLEDLIILWNNRKLDTLFEK